MGMGRMAIFGIVREDLPTEVTFEGRAEGEEGKEALTYPEKSIPIPVCENSQHVSQGPAKVLRNHKKLVWLEQSEWGESHSPRGQDGREWGDNIM